MTNNSIDISRYLSGEMNEDEIRDFENRIAANSDLKKEVIIQQHILTAIKDAGIKQAFSEAMKKQKLSKQLMYSGMAACIVLLLGLFFFFQQSNKKLHPIDDLVNGAIQVYDNVSKRQVQSALPGIDVPFYRYQVNAEKGDTIFHPSGSILCFPALSIVDKNGKPISGEVNISYREFNDPADFFISGIPMNYDSAGVDYQFESSAMCEIKAFHKGEQVFINKNKQPEIHLSSYNKSPQHNLYYFDSLSGSWAFVGKDAITEVKPKKEKRSIIGLGKNNTEVQAIVKPVKPAKASGVRPVFSIEIEPGSFEELFAFDRLKFEVLDDKTYRATDAQEHWDDVQLNRTDAEGIYKIRFQNNRRSVMYSVRPVLDEADYDIALKEFEVKNKQYEKLLQDRKEREQKSKEELAEQQNKIKQKFLAEEEKMNQVNNLIMQRNKEMRLLMKSAQNDSFSIEQALQRAAIDAKLSLDEKLIYLKQHEEKFKEDLSQTEEVMRSFQMDRFGIWNCDKPLNDPGEIYIRPEFVNTTGEQIWFQEVAVVNKQLNGLIRIPFKSDVRVTPGKPTMLWAILNSQLYYFSYKDFAASQLNRNSKSFTFQMRTWDGEIRNYHEMRKVLDQL